MEKNKAVSSVIATLLILTIVVLAIVTYTVWFNNYSSKSNAEVEVKTQSLSSDKVEIISIIGTNLYVNNLFNSSIEITKLQVNSQNCEGIFHYNLEPQINEISLANCLFNTGSGSKEIFILTNKTINSKTFYQNEELYPSSICSQKQKGDVNCNGIIDNDDIYALIYFAPKNILNLETADCDSDGLILIAQDGACINAIINS